jgi:hypothetical protein
LTDVIFVDFVSVDAIEVVFGASKSSAVVVLDDDSVESLAVDGDGFLVVDGDDNVRDRVRIGRLSRSNDGDGDGHILAMVFRNAASEI